MHDMNNYKERIRKILKENGLIIFPGEDDVEMDIDSLRFISIIVQIEEEFGIFIGDQYLGLEYKRLDDFTKLVETIMG